VTKIDSERYAARKLITKSKRTFYLRLTTTI